MDDGSTLNPEDVLAAVQLPMVKELEAVGIDKSYVAKKIKEQMEAVQTVRKLVSDDDGRNTYKVVQEPIYVVQQIATTTVLKLIGGFPRDSLAAPIPGVETRTSEERKLLMKNSLKVIQDTIKESNGKATDENS